MSYKYQNTTYPTLQIMLEILGFDAGSGVPEGVEYQHDTLPAHDSATQYVTWQREVGGNWSMIVVDRPLFARVVEGVVVDLNPAAAYDNVPIDRLTADQVAEADLWHEVPVSLRRHIRVGWLQDGETFAPADLAHLRDDLKNGARDMAEETRQRIANPTGNTEIGIWAVTATGMMLSEGGLPTPTWDMMLSVEAGARGVAVEVLRSEQIARAQQYLAISALSQGMAKQARDAFTAASTMDEMIAESERLRAIAQAAAADPAAAVAALLGA